MTRRTIDEQSPEEEDDLGRKVDKRVRVYTGKLSDDDWDSLDYEEEFESFERFKVKKKKGQR
jgi:hypothetical protein